MTLSHISTTLYAALITTAAYGIAVCLFSQSVMTMYRKRRMTGQVAWTLAIPSVMIFLFASLNVLGIWVNLQVALVDYPEGPLAYLALVSTKPKTALQTGQLGAIMTADLLMVYRTFILWDSNYYAVIIPCLTFVATFTTGVIFVHLQHIDDVETSIFSTTITEFTIAFLLCSFFTTVYCTGLIAFKMWTVDRNIRGPNRFSRAGSSMPSVGRRIMRIFVESAAIYSLMHLLYAILYAIKSNVEATPSYLEASVASIACSMIIIRCESLTARTGSAAAANYSSRPSKHAAPAVALNIFERSDHSGSSAHQHQGSLDFAKAGHHPGSLEFGKETLDGGDIDVMDITQKNSSERYNEV
ncbi:hypothetical protein FIBSPDRAFT_938792 [Athelia psychrophila]|uniref:Uncharacterized protein n=1 Tax=Athelia psychrophila TaxID=1759441 RepID=A0A165XRY7_9AGAM|nr:hypothetical protein FIBSPDRAFT_938792 [Fibularhizoctonia sp. CBS 109695]